MNGHCKILVDDPMEYFNVDKINRLDGFPVRRFDLVPGKRLYLVANYGGIRQPLSVKTFQAIFKDSCGIDL